MDELEDERPSEGETRKPGGGQFVKRLMDHQKEAGVFTTVSGLVEPLSDNPAARLAAQEIAQRVQQAQQQRTASQAAAL